MTALIASKGETPTGDLAPAPASAPERRMEPEGADVIVVVVVVATVVTEAIDTECVGASVDAGDNAGARTSLGLPTLSCEATCSFTCVGMQ